MVKSRRARRGGGCDQVITDEAAAGVENAKPANTELDNNMQYDVARDPNTTRQIRNSTVAASTPQLQKVALRRAFYGKGPCAGGPFKVIAGGKSRRRGGMGEATLRRAKELFGFTKPVPQENPQDVARRSWCDANFGRIPARQLQCYQEAPDDVSSSKPWPKYTRAGRRRSTRRGARASRKRPTR